MATTSHNGNLVLKRNSHFPPDVKQNPIFSRVIRYVATATQTNLSITPLNIIQCCFFTTTNGSTSGILIANAIRIRRISMYFAASDFTTTAPLSFRWKGFQNAPEELITDRGTSTVPACIKVMPPRDSVGGYWYSVDAPTATSALFEIDCPSGTILDLDFEFTMTDSNTTANHTITLSGAATTTGLAYGQFPISNTTFGPDGGVTQYHS